MQTKTAFGNKTAPFVLKQLVFKLDQSGSKSLILILLTHSALGSVQMMLHRTGGAFRLFALVSLRILLATAIVIPDLEMDCYIEEGDLNIAFIKQIHTMDIDSFCGEDLESEYELQYVEAFRWAVHQVNARTDLLPNLTLGFAVLDDCGRDLTALAKTLYLIPDDSDHRNRR